jgi:phytoene dehydrogenase-like protein
MPAALDRSYDGIIIGAGHHGLVLGSYLARCGLDILLVDRRLQYGGALATEEVTAPGFYHNLHSIIISTSARPPGSRIWPSPTESPTLRHATSSASPTSTARR